MRNLLVSTCADRALDCLYKIMAAKTPNSVQNESYGALCIIEWITVSPAESFAKLSPDTVNYSLISAMSIYGSVSETIKLKALNCLIGQCLNKDEVEKIDCLHWETIIDAFVSCANSTFVYKSELLNGDSSADLGSGNLFIQLCEIIFDNFEKLSLTSQSKYIEILIKIHPQAHTSMNLVQIADMTKYARFVLRVWTRIFTFVLNEDNFGFQDRVMEIVNIYYKNTASVELRILVFEFLDLVVLSETSPDLTKKLAHLLAATLETEVDFTCFEKCLDWIQRNTDTYDQVVFDCLISCIIEVTSPLRSSLTLFWEDRVRKHTSIKVVECPFKPGGQYVSTKKHSDPVNPAAVLCFNYAIKWYVRLMRLGHLQYALKIYVWICRITCWINTVHPDIIKIGVLFLGRFSIGQSGYISYTSTGETGNLIVSKSRIRPSEFPFKEYIYCVTTILKYAIDYASLTHLLLVLPSHFQSRKLWLEKTCAVELVRFLKTVCEIIQTESAGSALTNVPALSRKSDLYAMYYRLMIPLISFKAVFSRSQLDLIINTLQFGLGRWPTSGKICMEGLTLCLYEIPGNMLKHVPPLIHKISQITSQAMSIPNLEFLSTLGRKMGLCVNFIDADYKRVLGIALQYLRTSTTTYSGIYTVQMGYQVVSMWFLGMKVSERKKFVGFVVQHLSSQQPIIQSQSTPNLFSAVGSDESVELVCDLVLVHLI